MHVVGLVVEHDEIVQPLQPVQHGGLARRNVLRRLPTKQGVDGVLGCPSTFPRLLDLIDVRDEHVPARIGLDPLAA
jgi:hypothetical protein